MVERSPTGEVVLFLRGVTDFRRKFRRGSPTPTPKPRRGGEPSMGFCRGVYGYTCRRQDGKLLRSCVRESSIESSAGDRCCDVAATCFCRRNGSQNEPQDWWAPTTCTRQLSHQEKSNDEACCSSAKRPPVDQIPAHILRLPAPPPPPPPPPFASIEFCMTDIIVIRRSSRLFDSAACACIFSSRVVCRFITLLSW
jgi:hypothetical protein